MYYIDESEVPSYDKHRTYKIRKGDTLQSVADALGIDAQELRRYHNIYCELPDLIEADFKGHLKLLILAPEKDKTSKKEEIEKKTEKVSLGSNYKLPFSPERTDKKYKVKYTSKIGDEIDVMELVINVKWIAVDANKYHLFEVNRAADIYINGRLPDTMMSELAAKTAQVLYPLKIVVDEFGKWIDIYNYNEIESRWGKIKSEILDYYEGELVEGYIEQTEFVLENSERLLNSLRSDYFLRTFFNGIHVEYTADYGFQNDLQFPLEEEAESVFSVQQKMDPNLDDAGFIKIEQKGNYVDSGFGFLYGYTPLKVNYNAVYVLNSENYIIEKMNLECNIEKDIPIKTIIAIEIFDNKKK
ncbi:LysM peptidoglycan-binding domain-containing protein [Pseudomonas shirazensis]